MRTILLSGSLSLIFLPAGLIRAESLAAGSSTALDPKAAAETELVVERIQRLADDARLGAPQFSMIGEVRGGGRSWWINGEEFFVDDSTVVTGELRSGKMIEVRGLLGDPKELLARQVTVLETSDSPRGAAPRGISLKEAQALR